MFTKYSKAVLNIVRPIWPEADIKSICLLIRRLQPADVALHHLNPSISFREIFAPASQARNICERIFMIAGRHRETE